MKINKVTITGADDKIIIEELTYLGVKFPCVEWGILFSKSKEGQQRYPSKEWINSLSDAKLNLSAHFCGWYAKEIMEHQNFDLITNLDENFKRIQINYNFKNSSGYNLEKLEEYAKTIDRKIILQFNKSNSEILDKYGLLAVPCNFEFLYDGSGGRGTPMENIGAPIGNNYTGYSGGIDMYNVASICENIDAVKRDAKVWIDMESGVRTDNEFDLIKVRSVLNRTRTFITR